MLSKGCEDPNLAKCRGGRDIPRYSRYSIAVYARLCIQLSDYNLDISLLCCAGVSAQSPCAQSAGRISMFMTRKVSLRYYVLVGSRQDFVSDSVGLGGNRTIIYSSTLLWVF